MATYRTRELPDGSRRYDFRVKVRGRVRARTFSHLTDGREWARRAERDLQRETAGLGTAYTVGDAIDAYIELELPDLAPSNHARRRRHLEWWRERIGHIRLAELTPAEIARWRNSIRASGGTKNRYQSAISIVLSHAVKSWHWIDRNPALQVRRRPEPRGRIRYLTPEERDALLAACEAEKDPRLYPMVLLALTTGARQGELVALRWEDIDLDERVAIVRTSKNQDARPLHLGARAVAVLEEYAKGGATGRLFGAYPRKAFERACRRAGVDEFRFHDLRHTFASYLAMSGASLPELAAALGHRTLAMVQRYAHLSPQHAASVVRRVDFLAPSIGGARATDPPPPCRGNPSSRS